MHETYEQAEWRREERLLSDLHIVMLGSGASSEDFIRRIREKGVSRARAEQFLREIQQLSRGFENRG